MNSKSVIVLMVQFMLAGAPLNRQAAAQDRLQHPVQQCVLTRKPSPDCLSHSDTVRAKDNRQAMFRKQGGIHSLPSQGDLLQELLPSSEIRPVAIQMENEKRAEHGIDYRIDTQESGLLEELLAETAMP